MNAYAVGMTPSGSVGKGGLAVTVTGFSLIDAIQSASAQAELATGLDDWDVVDITEFDADDPYEVAEGYLNTVDWDAVYGMLGSQEV